METRGPRRITSTRNWRRTRLTCADDSPIPDDWTLEDAPGQPLGRIYAETGGPQRGRWCWAVQITPHGTPFNGGTGHAATGREAWEAVEPIWLDKPETAARTRGRIETILNAARFVGFIDRDAPNRPDVTDTSN